jgi:hypothetical protein
MEKIMRERIEEILDILINGVKEGKDIDDCLKQYPEYADDLRPLLLLASGIEDSPKPEVDPIAFKRTMAKVNSIEGQGEVENNFFTLRSLIFRPVVIRAASIIFAFTFIIAMTFSFSANSLPGDSLYPVKCFCEKAQLSMTFSKEGRAELHLRLAERKTEDFMLTFKKKEKINEELLNGMLEETSSALLYCNFLSSDKCASLVSKVKGCAQSQISALQVVKPLVDDSFIPIVDEAIYECSLRCSCADSCFLSGNCRCGESK